MQSNRRIDRALYAVLIEAYVHGVSTRKLDDLLKRSASRRASRGSADATYNRHPGRR